MASAISPLISFDNGTATTAWIGWQAVSSVNNATGGTLAWQFWNSQIQVLSTTIQCSTMALQEQWAFWNRNYDQIAIDFVQSQSSAEELAALEEQRIRYEEEKRQKEEKALLLLMSTLDEQQQETWKKESRFDVLVKGKLYRIKKSERVVLLNEKKKPSVAYCIHPELHHGLPAADVALTQKLLLETDEELFLKTANATRLAS